MILKHSEDRRKCRAVMAKYKEDTPEYQFAYWLDVHYRYCDLGRAWSIGIGSFLLLTGALVAAVEMGYI